MKSLAYMQCKFYCFINRSIFFRFPKGLDFNENLQIHEFGNENNTITNKLYTKGFTLVETVLTGNRCYRHGYVDGSITHGYGHYERSWH